MNQKQDPAINFKVLLLSAIISWVTIFTVYVSLAQNPVFGVKKVTLAVVVWFLVAGGYYALIQRFILKFLGHSSIKNLPVFLVLGLSSLFFCLFVPGRLAFFVPHTVTITPLPEAAGLPDKQIVILGLHNGDTHVSHKTIQAGGGWEYRAVRFTAFSSAASPLVWQGRSNRQIRVELLTGPNMGSAVLDADGSRTTVNLNAPGESAASVPLEVRIPFTLKLAYNLCSFIAFYAAQLAFVSLLAYFQKKQGKIPAALFFPVVFLFLVALPVIFLLIYFPGIINGDSIVQFKQIRTGSFTNSHPFFHTLIMLVLLKLWNNPAVVPVFQIILLSAILIITLNLFRKKGLSDGSAVLLAALMGLSLTNAIFLNSPWKDVLFSLCLMALTACVYFIIDSNGSVLKNGFFAAAFACANIGIFLIRHNGFPIILATAAILLVWLKKKQLLIASLSITALVISLFNFLVLPAFHVAQAPANFKFQPFIYQIAAHLDAGTPMTAEEISLLDNYIPIEKWVYNPCDSTALTWDIPTRSASENQYLASHGRDFYLLFAKLFLRDPFVNLRHMLVSASIVYRIDPICRTEISPLLFKPESSIGAEWVDTPDELIREASILPALVKPVTRFLSWTFEYTDLRLLNVVFWRPAFWLLLVVLATLFLWRITKKGGMLIVAVPALTQSAVLFAANVATNVRYQLGIAFTAQFLMLVCVMVWVIKTNPKHSGD